MTEQEQQAQPTPEEQQQLAEVAQAGGEAAARGEDPGPAMKAKRDEVGLKMSDEDIEKVSENLFGKLASLFEERGAFDAPPEPVRPPEQPAAPPEPAPAAAAEQTPAPQAPAPQKRNAAQRFLGID